MLDTVSCQRQVSGGGYASGVSKSNIETAVFVLLDLSNSVSGLIRDPQIRECCRQRRVSDITLLY